MLFQLPLFILEVSPLFNLLMINIAITLPVLIVLNLSYFMAFSSLIWKFNFPIILDVRMGSILEPVAFLIDLFAN